LYETFSYFGNILSCKVCTKKVEKVGKDGKTTIEDESLGYGFVHFETPEAAKLACQKVNGMLIEGKKVSVAPFVRKVERSNTSGDLYFTNVYIKDLDTALDTKGLEVFFKKFGEITSASVSTDKDGKSKGFAFLNYKDAESAKKACAECDGKVIEGVSAKGKPLYCGKAEKKEDRKMKLMKQYENKRQETQGLNLYVKNIDETWSEDKLREIFEKFGTLTSCAIMKDDKEVSRGFGFVCFSNAEDAGKAISELHNKIFSNKPLYVSLAQRKDARRQELEQQFIQRSQNVRMYGPQMIFPGVQPRQGGYMYSQPNKPRWTGNQTNTGKFEKDQKPERTGKGKKPEGGVKTDRKPKEKFEKKPTGQTTTPQQGDIKFVQNVRNPKQEQVKTEKKKQVVQQESSDAFNASHLANMSPRSQKQTLGDHLYPMVHSNQPELASKITGMLLEMENSDILHLLESQEALAAKISEAVIVLKQHQQ
jgi:polyadenylate-binding protein